MADSALSYIGAALVTVLSLAFAATYGEAIVRLMRQVALP